MPGPAPSCKALTIRPATCDPSSKASRTENQRQNGRKRFNASGDRWPDFAGNYSGELPRSLVRHRKKVRRKRAGGKSLMRAEFPSAESKQVLCGERAQKVSVFQNPVFVH